MEVIGMNGLMVGAILLAGVVLGLLLGRRTSAARARARQLEGELEELRTDHERAQVEIRAGKDEFERAKTEIRKGRDELESAQAEIRKGREELERAQTEIREGREELERTREGLESYRGKVTDHFVGTSERLRELTFQYRAIYNHLAEGAGELCPEGFEKLDGGLGLDALPEESETPESESH
jgi:uncharacterized membrane-anchored protein YhcB (DUF1043 family)